MIPILYFYSISMKSIAALPHCRKINSEISLQQQPRINTLKLRSDQTPGLLWANSVFTPTKIRVCSD